MIYVEMHGRLGNQMFQYAAARKLQLETDQRLLLNFKKVNGANTEGTTGWEDSLKDFKVSKYETATDCNDLFCKLSVVKRILCIIYAISYRPFMKNVNAWNRYQKKWCPVLDKLGIRWLANGYFEFKNNSSKDILMNGSFEAPQYFEKIRNHLIDEFKPKRIPLNQNFELYDIIESTNSICVSVRHFQLEGYQKNLYDVCTKQYYDSAIKYMKGKLDNPHFIFFSDDIEWVKSVFDMSDLSYSFETPNNPVWEKFRLMSSCKHFIIPNSTFAWWTQYLGEYSEKIVIGPSKWFNNAYESPLIQDNWIKISSDGGVVN